MQVISEDGRFEWDSWKDELNVQKHGFSFSEILEIFDDPFLLTRSDTRYSTMDEHREFSLGSLNGILVIAASHTDRNGRIRIISARQAEPKLREVYYGYINEINR